MTTRNVACAVLKQLGEVMKVDSGITCLLALLRLSPLLPELVGVLTTQATLKNQKIIMALFWAIAGILRVRDVKGKILHEDKILIRAAQEHLAELVMKSKMKARRDSTTVEAQK